MSTGKISQPRRVSIGLFEFIVLQGGYTPTDFLQLNASATFGYWSLGTKIQLLGETGAFHGLSIGGDLGFMPDPNTQSWTQATVRWFNIASSFGSEQVEGHINFVGSGFGPVFPSIIQIGVSTTIIKEPTNGAKLMVESWYIKNEHENKIDAVLLVAGIRAYGNSFVGEIAFMAGPSLSFDVGGGSSSPSRFEVYPIPYFSLMWFI